jgi:hypothetical protein
MPFFDPAIERNLVELEALVKETRAAESPTQLIKQLEILRTAQRDLYAKVSELKNYQDSAIYSLPNETLAAIFDCGQYIVPDRGYGNEHQAALYPVLMSHVSRRWRIVAAQTPCLWSSIAALELSPELLELYLKRSGSHLLDISMNFNNSVDLGWWMPIGLSILNDHVARWYSLSITSTSGNHLSLYHTIDSFRALCAPRLYSIHIDVQVQEDPEWIPSPFDIFTGGAAALTSVRVDGLALDYCCPPLQTVVRLELPESRRPGESSEVEDDTLGRRLSTITSLQHLAINPNNFTFHEPAASIELPTLLSLEFVLPDGQLCSFVNLAGFCVATSTPSITTLILNGFVAYEVERLVGILDAHQPKYSGLRSLQLCKSEVTESIPFPSILPNIRELVMTGSPCNVLLQDLCLTAAQTDPAASSAIIVPWPDLDSITINPITDDEMHSLCELVSSRAALGYPLGCVRSSFAEVSADRVEWLRERVNVEIC